jgi:hypothetical protein
MKTILLTCVSVALLSASALAANFTPGDLVVDEVSSSAALTSSATAVYLLQYTTGGTAAGSIELPTTSSGATNAFTQSGAASSEGELSLSPNGQYLTLAGYDAAVGTSGVTSSNTTGAGGVARTIAIVSANETVDTSTTLVGSALDGNNIRSAVTADGTNIYVAGAAGGVDYTTVGSTGSNDFTQLNTTDTNFGQVDIFGGQLYASSGKKNLTVATIGTNLPTTGSQTITNLSGLPTSGTTYGFYFADVGSSSPNDLYMAYATGSIAEVAKYYLNGGTWHAAGTVTENNVEGITGQVVGGSVDLYFTTPTNIYSLVDSSGQSGTLTGSPTTEATAGTDSAFLGIAFAPVPEPSAWVTILCGLTGLVLYQSRRRRRSRVLNG